MARFLNTSNAYAAIEDIVDKASSRVVLISPSIRIPPRLLYRLKYTDSKGVVIGVVCRRRDLSGNARSDLRQLKNLELRFDEALYAKCFFNERSMVMGSLNLHEYPQQRNRDMGVFLSAADDHEVFHEAMREAGLIFANAEKDGLLKAMVDGARAVINSIGSQPKSKIPRKGEMASSGYCIRCGMTIPLKTKRPYCGQCFRSWNNDAEHRETFCHSCGMPAPTSWARPWCSTCYSTAPVAASPRA